MTHPEHPYETYPIRISPELVEHQPSPEVIMQSAPQLAALLVSNWPQVTLRESSKETIHYIISGSLAVALIAGVDAIYDARQRISYPVDNEAKQYYQKAVHAIHDVDTIRKAHPWPDSFDRLYDAFRQETLKLPCTSQLDVDPFIDHVRSYHNEQPVFVDTKSGSFIISRPDEIVAYKLIGALSGFFKKPYQFNNEIPYLMKAAEHIFSTEHVWNTVEQVFRGHDEKFQELEVPHIMIGYQLNCALNDPCLSDGVKEMLSHAAVISDTE